MFSLLQVLRLPSPSQSTAHSCNKSNRTEVRNNVHTHFSLHEVTSHSHILPTFLAFSFEIVKTGSRF